MMHLSKRFSMVTTGCQAGSDSPLRASHDWERQTVVLEWHPDPTVGPARSTSITSIFDVAPPCPHSIPFSCAVVRLRRMTYCWLTPPRWTSLLTRQPRD